MITPAADLPLGSLVTFGLDSARGDMLSCATADGTFSPRDVDKLLVYLRDADLVLGTRTTRQMIEQGSNMRGVVRAAHVALAKCSRSPSGASSPASRTSAALPRLLALDLSRHPAQLTATGVEVLVEMAIEVLRARRRIVEIPVSYRNPDIEQPHVRSSTRRQPRFGRVLGLIARKRLDDTALARRLRRPVQPASSSTPRCCTSKSSPEEEWQDRAGVERLDVPHDQPGALAVYERQSSDCRACLTTRPQGPDRRGGLRQGASAARRAKARPQRRSLLLGCDVSRAVASLPPAGLAGCMADGEFLAVAHWQRRGRAVRRLVHHLIDYGAALREAARVVKPGGLLVVYEPLTSWFSHAMHRLLDPIVFRLCGVYESPIDIRYKKDFRESAVRRCLGASSRCPWTRSPTPISWPTRSPAATRARCSPRTASSCSGSSHPRGADRAYARGRRDRPGPGVAVHRGRRESTMSATSSAPASLDIIVPVYNEEASIDAFMTRLRPLGYTDALQFVDNASTDGTVARILEHGARRVRHRHNEGYGASIRTGSRRPAAS